MTPAHVVGVVLAFGLLCITVGVGLLFGYACALITWGVLSSALVLAYTYRRGPTP